MSVALGFDAVAVRPDPVRDVRPEDLEPYRRELTGYAPLVAGPPTAAPTGAGVATGAPRLTIDTTSLASTASTWSGVRGARRSRSYVAYDVSAPRASVASSTLQCARI